MKKSIEEIIDKMTPEEIDEIVKNDDMTNDEDVAKIAASAKVKAGISSADVKKTHKKINAKRLVLIAACIALAASLTLGTVVFLNTRNNNNGVFGPIEKSKDIDYSDGVIGAEYANKESGSTLFERIEGIFSRKEMAEADIAPSKNGDIVAAEKSDESQFRAGTLTSSEWKDLKAQNIAEWQKLLSQGGEFSSYAKTRNIYANNIVPVYVDYNGSPCFNCKVELLDGQEKVLYTSVTDVNGNAYLLYNVNSTNETPAYVKIGDTKTAIGQDKNQIIKLNAQSAGIKVEALDLMLMIDTTGSMSDELSYLQVELKDMVKRIAENGQTISIRVSVNFYRDKGDEYIVKYFDFRSDIDECVKQIGSQNANGGGDIPEAVHTALDNAINGHTWRENAVKICFFVLDAPPHSEAEIQGINSTLVTLLKTASESGIRIIPVASSGVDKECEYLFRTFAVMTGGTYVYLTNDSGYGNSHIAASVGEKNVEKLNECMIRIISEYCGITYTAPTNNNQQ